MNESGISLSADRFSFRQVEGFQSVMVANNSNPCSASGCPCSQYGITAGCLSYLDSSTGQWYLFYYPDNDSVQYLYESYPKQISPLDGIKDEHFLVWMRPTFLPTFRKLYGSISGNFQSGDQLVFAIEANFEVESFEGSKTLIITQLGQAGGKNKYTGTLYIIVGSISIFLGLAVAFHEYKQERKFGKRV
jgi:LEM3 (ligand-effect modulator 3) family / CDC50 family